MAPPATPPPDFTHERAWRARGARVVVGVDEAGRGPLAGPVVAAAVALDPDRIPDGIRDSKELAPADRESIFDEIRRTAVFGVGVAPVERIESDNILWATMWAMAQAVAALGARPCVALVDGDRLPELDCPGEAIVGGDGRSLSIAAASIVAKVTRDRMMDELAREYPGYGFEHHRGYATPGHLEALARLGPTPHHRRGFAPVAAVLAMPRRRR